MIDTDDREVTERLKNQVLSMMTSCEVVNQKNEDIYRGELASFVRQPPLGLMHEIRSRGGACYIETVKGKKFLVASFPGRDNRKGGWIINLLLFVATIFSTLFVGAFLEGADFGEGLGNLAAGIPFSIAILVILGLHELGHYFAARRYGLDVSLPYFIPFPTILGTLGAFIKIRSPIHNRRMLIEVGAAGPIAGLLASIPAVVYGLSLSTFQEIAPEEIEGLSLGSSFLFSALERVVVGPTPEGQELFLHPIAFAGWAGFFVTALNLLPIGQLDGGHISYALFGSLQKRISQVVFVVLIPLGFLWPGWLMLITLIIILIKIPHPPVVYEEVPLDRSRIVLGWITILVFLLTFIPLPIRIS